MSKKMIATNLIYSFSQTVNDSRKRKSKKIEAEEKTDPDENLIIEEYEGSCDDCLEKTQEPKCPICG